MCWGGVSHASLAHTSRQSMSHPVLQQELLSSSALVHSLRPCAVHSAAASARVAASVFTSGKSGSALKPEPVRSRVRQTETQDGSAPPQHRMAARCCTSAHNGSRRCQPSEPFLQPATR